MKQTIEAVYENGALRPLRADAVVLPEGQRVKIVISDEVEPEALRLATRVYEGLSDHEVDEVERIALARSSFFLAGNAD